MTDYSTNFRKLRIESGHTQESMAFCLGISTSVINRIESGKRKINMDMIPKIAVALKKSPEDVLKDLNGIIINNSIKDNNGNGVNVEQGEVKKIIELYEKLLSEKDKYISLLEAKVVQK